MQPFAGFAPPFASSSRSFRRSHKVNGFIELVTGTLGGGKTAFAVERVYEHLKRGGWVFTNVEVYPDKIAERLKSEGYVFDPARLVVLKGDCREYHKEVKRGTAESLVMLVIDEAGLEMNSRDWAKTSKEQLAFNTMARKLDIWLVYISQDANDVDKQVRRKADTVWVCRNMKKCKLWGVIPFPLPFYFRVRFDNTRGTKPQKMDSEVFLKSPAWGLYNSDAMVGQVADSFRHLKTAEAAPLARIKNPVPLGGQISGGWVESAVVAFSACVVSFLSS